MFNLNYTIQTSWQLNRILLIGITLFTLLSSPVSLGQSHYPELEQAIVERDWQSALDLVDQMIHQDPNRSKELLQYRDQIILLAQSDGVSLNLSGNVDPQTSDPSAATSVDWGPWLDQLQRKIEQNWIPGSAGVSRDISVQFVVNRAGQINQISLDKSSGSSEVDDNALQAILKATPFLPLPAEYQGSSVSIIFTFNIHVLGNPE